MDQSNLKEILVDLTNPKEAVRSPKGSFGILMGAKGSKMAQTMLKGFLMGSMGVPVDGHNKF